MKSDDVLTQRHIDAYLQGGGVLCPFCKSNHIDGEDDLEVDSDGASQTISCRICNKKWVDIYTLTGVEECDE